MQHEEKDRNINSAWTFVGPSSSPYGSSANLNGIGRVNKVVFHPLNQDTYFICTPNGGLWRTTNDGVSWTNMTDYLPCLGIADFVISWANVNVMYLLTGDPADGWDGFGYGQRSIGILKSTDGGASWHHTGVLPSTNDDYNGNALVQSPTNQNLLIAATNTGLYRTTDGGNTWVQEMTGDWWDVKFKPFDGTRVYATQGHAFFVSADSGDNWTSNSTFDVSMSTCSPFGGNRVLIGVAPTGTSRVYLLSAPRISEGVFCGVWLSTDSGSSFTRQSTEPNVFGSSDDGSDDTDQTNYDMAIAVQSNASTIIYAAGCTVWKSLNSGASWTHVTSYSENGQFPYIHPDVHGLQFNPDNNHLFASTDGGLYKSEDFGATWANLSNNIETSQFYHMRGWDGNINKLLGGLQDNGVKYRKDNSSAFYHISGADGFDVAFNPLTGKPSYASINTAVVKYWSDGAWAYDVEVPNDQWFKPLAVHNTDTNIVLVGTGMGIFKASNGFWVNTGGEGSWALTSCPSNSTRFYAAGGSNFQYNSDGKLYFSSNAGDSWILKSSNPGFPDSDEFVKITDVAVRPTNSSTVFASFGGYNEDLKVLMSTNTGDSWSNISANLPNIPINCLAIDNDNGVYAGTDIGVFYRGPTMTNWMTWSNGMPNVPVVDLVIFDDGSIKRIRAATYGRGVWQSNLASTCDAAIIVTGNLEGVRHYEASSTLTSSSIIEGGLGTFVSFQSGNYITLNEGFNVINKSEFLGFISPCGMGGIPSATGDIPINRADPNSSIIILRKMWDPEDELPFGFIQKIKHENDFVKINFQIKKPGKVQLVAARQIQEKLEVLYTGETTDGQHEITANIAHLPKEFHYVMLFYEGKVVDFQELE